jgi:hypothetical protein
MAATIIKYVVYWGEDIYDSYSNLKDARYVTNKYKHKHPNSMFKITKQVITEVEVERI